MSPELILAIVNSLLVVFLGIGGRLWTGKRLKEIEGSLAKEQYVYQIRFNREFQIYRYLWQQLATVIRLGKILLSPNEQTIEKENQKKKDLTEALGHVYAVIDNNIPFFSPDVYALTKEILDILNEATSALRIKMKPDVHDVHVVHMEAEFDDFDKAKEAINKIYPIADKVKEAIRSSIFPEYKKPLVASFPSP